MSMLSPTPYRDTLTKAQRMIYRQITAGILEKRTEISVRNSLTVQEDLPYVLECIHRDHPELFWINWWSGMTMVPVPALMKTEIRFTSLLEPPMIDACNRTLEKKIEMLSDGFPGSGPPEMQYRFILRECMDNVDYKDTGSALWDHTIIGPLLSHTAVCEGISKLFLLYCQHFSLPCISVKGSCNNISHAWNAVVIDQNLFHIDITAALQHGKSCGQWFSPFKTSIQLKKLGYRWEERVPLNVSGR